jgi:hypothetical protein
MYWSVQAESHHANMYVWNLPESDADLSDEISWAQLPGSGYRDPIAIASKYAAKVRRTQLPMHILAYKVQHIHAVGDEVANPTTPTSIQVQRVAQKRKSSSVTTDVGALQGVADAIEGPAALRSGAAPLIGSNQIVSSNRQDASQSQGGTMAESLVNEGNANDEACVQGQSLDMEGGVPKKVKTVEGSSGDLPIILSGNSSGPGRTSGPMLGGLHA